MLTSDQLRAARALLRWDQAQLASRSGVSIETVKRLEKIEGVLSATRVATIEALRAALERAGVEFIPENGGGAGLRLKKRNSSLGHARPSGPATDAVDVMERAIAKDRGSTRKDRLASVKETGEEVPQEEWERFEAADKKPSK